MQVIINIVNNAIKYTPLGSTIKITTKKLNQVLSLEISDDGEGVPDDQKKNFLKCFILVIT